MTDGLGPDFDDRLKKELDRFEGPTPLPESARFGRAQAGRRLGPLKPALSLAAAMAILTVAASALAGSPNPGVWTERAVNSIETVTHASQSSPPPATSEGSHAPGSRPSSHSQPSRAGETGRESPEPSGARQEPSESPRPSPSPEPDGHNSTSPTPTPTPSSDEGVHQSPSPSPSDSNS